MFRLAPRFRTLSRYVRRGLTTQHHRGGNGDGERAVKLFSPSTHVWIAAEPAPSSDHSATESSPSERWHVTLGLTERGYEEIGDVEGVRVLSPTTTVSAVGQDLVGISWHGHRITRADELYHTVWETIEEDSTVRSPVRGELLEVASETCLEEYGSDAWLAKVSTTKEMLWEDVNSGNDAWVDEEEYDARTEQMPRGAFADV